VAQVAPATRKHHVNLAPETNPVPVPATGPFAQANPTLFALRALVDKTALRSLARVDETQVDQLHAMEEVAAVTSKGLQLAENQPVHLTIFHHRPLQVVQFKCSIITTGAGQLCNLLLLVCDLQSHLLLPLFELLDLRLGRTLIGTPSRRSTYLGPLQKLLDADLALHLAEAKEATVTHCCRHPRCCDLVTIVGHLHEWDRSTRVEKLNVHISLSVECCTREDEPLSKAGQERCARNRLGMCVE